VWNREEGRTRYYALPEGERLVDKMMLHAPMVRKNASTSLVISQRTSGAPNPEADPGHPVGTIPNALMAHCASFGPA
jgi:hypothetical protein